MMQINAKARLTIAATVPEVNRVLQRMAATIDPQHATGNQPPFTMATCHGQVALEVKKRGIPTDLIWIYGDGRNVAHSVLTNEDHQVVMDTFKKSGKFLGAKGYTLSDDKYDLLDVLPVSELFDDFMSYEVKAEASDDAESEASKSRKEGIDRQIENNKKQQEQVKKTMPSAENKTAVSPVQKLDKQKQVNRLKDQALDMRKQKLES